MKLVVGLGNPGPRYADTRHNVGVRVLERFAREHGLALDARRFGSRFGSGWLAGGEPRLDVALLAPETFMNRSGEAVAEAVAELEIARRRARSARACSTTSTSRSGGCGCAPRAAPAATAASPT